MLQPYDNSDSYVEAIRDLNTSVGGIIGTIAFYDDATALATRQFGISESSTTSDVPQMRIPLSSFKALIVNTTIASGSVLRAYLQPATAEGAATGTVTVTACKLVVLEV
jgi:hypothetical protein